MKPRQSRIMVWMAWTVMFSFAYFGIYMVKYQVQEKKNKVELVERQLREEQKNLHVLSAEWTYLNRPDRLRRLADKYLDVKPVHGAQMSDFASLPMPALNVASQTDNHDMDEEEGAPVASHVSFSSGALPVGAAHGQ